jgi:hypothetical protein
MAIPLYENIPYTFRDANNEWNKLAYFIYDEGSSKLNLTERQGTNLEGAWIKIGEVYAIRDIQDFYKMALAAWMLYSTYQSFEYKK